MVSDAGRGLPPQLELEVMFAVLTVGPRPGGQQAQPPTPPGVLPALTDHGPQETTGLLQGQEGGQLQVGQHQRDHGRGQCGEQGADHGAGAGAGAGAVTGAHHYSHSYSFTLNLQHCSNTKALRCIFSLFGANPVQESFLFT